MMFTTKSLALRLSLIMLASLCPMLNLTAQVSNVNPTIKIKGGKPFYIHTVLDGQTIEQIAKAYYSDEATLKKSNTGISDPLADGAKIKIPYSAKSLEAMSNAKSTPPKSTPKPTITKPTVKPEQTAPPEQPTPIEEAAALIPDPEPEQVAEPEQTIPVKKEEDISVTADPTPPHEEKLTEEEETRLQDLTKLSQNISESLANLAEIKKSLTGTEEKDSAPIETNAIPKGIEMPSDTKYAIELLDEFMAAYFDTASANDYRLHEFFFAGFNSDMRINQLVDERTATNDNTHFMMPIDLFGIKIDSLSSAKSKEAIGLTTVAKQYKYKVKVKRNKVRVYKTQGYVEHFPKDNEHAQLILKTAKEKGLKGKGEVVIIEGAHEVASYTPFEYNPFGTKDNRIMRKSFLLIENMEF